MDKSNADVISIIHAASIGKAVIESDILNLPQAARNVLVYIIEKKPIDYTTNNPAVILDGVEIVNFFAERFSKSYASTTNINRGIKELEREGVIINDTSVKNLYYLSNKIVL